MKWTLIAQALRPIIDKSELMNLKRFCIARVPPFK